MTDQGPSSKKLENLKRRLEKLKEQRAIKGISTPPEVLNEIEDLEAEIAALEETEAAERLAQMPTGSPPPGPAEPAAAPIPANPFIAGPPIKDPRFFVGRRAQLQAIIGRIEGVQPTSLNLVGESRIGKTSLLFHLEQTWAERVRDRSRYTLVYLSLQDGGTRTQADFFGCLAQALAQRPAVQQHPGLVAALETHPMTCADFTRTMSAFEAVGLLPIVCLDEFGALFEKPREFDDDFYNALRALMDGSQLMLIVSTLQPVSVYRRQHRFTSRFFNQGHTEHLAEFTEEEVTELLRLPESTMPGSGTALGLHEQKLARRWGSRHPFLLQLAAHFLRRAGLEGRNEAWARERFNTEARPYRPRGLKRLARTGGALLWRGPQHLGRLAYGLGEGLDSFKNWLTGVIIIIVAIVGVTLVVLGLINWQQLLALLHQLL